MKIPIKITPCPIIEAIVEIRFDSKLPHDAIFGIIYQAFKKDYPKYEKFPILQLPEAIRSQDKNLIYKPYYKIFNDILTFNIGPKVISLSVVSDDSREYIGWKNFSLKLQEWLQKMRYLEIIEYITRLGIRYINYFDLDVYSKINLSILLKEQPLNSKELLIKTLLQTGDFLSTLQIANNAKVQVGGKFKNGSVIDVDTFLNLEKQELSDDFFDLIESGHMEEKKLFFSLLNTVFLEQLNPKY